METNATREQLLRRWLHSHEEDSATEMVFRPHDFAFPLSRGRAGFEFRADGSFVDIGIAAADGWELTDGRWELENPNSIRLTLHDDPPRDRVVRVISIAADRFVIAR